MADLAVRNNSNWSGFIARFQRPHFISLSTKGVHAWVNHCAEVMVCSCQDHVKGSIFRATTFLAATILYVCHGDQSGLVRMDGPAPYNSYMENYSTTLSSTTSRRELIFKPSWPCDTTWLSHQWFRRWPVVLASSHYSSKADWLIYLQWDRQETFTFKFAEKECIAFNYYIIKLCFCLGPNKWVIVIFRYLVSSRCFFSKQKDVWPLALVKYRSQETWY